MPSLLPHISHIYVEREARDLPAAQEFIARYPKAQLVEINSYKEIFARPRQVWQLQAQSRKVILAKRRDQFLYRGSPYCDALGAENFFYNTLAMNCIYNCDYCYLQGLYPSANLVFFVNVEDYLRTTEQALAEFRQIYLCLSYDTDILALDGLFSYCGAWLQFAEAQPNLLLEIRTKSANVTPLLKQRPLKNVICAWTLSPENYARVYEHGAPNLELRLKAARALQDHGWALRLCFDPLLALPDFEVSYAQLIERCFQVLDPSLIRDVTVGTFRMNHEFLDKIRARRLEPEFLFYPFEKRGKSVGYPSAVQENLTSHVSELLVRYLPQSKIALNAN